MNRQVRNSLPYGRPASLRLAPLVPILVLSACASVLGIEDIQEGADPGNGGSNTTTTAQGGDESNGGANSPTASMGGTSNAGQPSVGGETSLGGSSNLAGDGNAAGGDNPPDPTVHGRIIDYWGHALADVPVQIDEQQTFTDDGGNFTFANVPAVYTVSFVVRPLGEDYGWVYQDLTRRDPTLQVYGGRDQRETGVLVKVTGATLGANETITAAFGTPHGSTEATELSDSPDGNNTSPDLRGPLTTDGTAHALWWSTDGTTQLPSAYKSYQSQATTLNSNADGDLSFDLTPMTIAAGAVTGTVTPFSDDTRTNAAFLRFASNAHIQLVDTADPAPNAFSYVVPQLPDCSVTVMAREGYYAGPMGIAHRDGLSPGDASVTLDIPEPAQPLKPTSNDDVSETDFFNFRPSDDNAGAFLITIENSDFVQSLNIVTSRVQFTLPEVADGIFSLDANQHYRWWVETHGDFATVDEMTGPSGFMDEFSGDWESPVGPKQQDGSFTLSGAPGFFFVP